MQGSPTELYLGVLLIRWLPAFLALLVSVIALVISLQARARAAKAVEVPEDLAAKVSAIHTQTALLEEQLCTYIKRESARASNAARGVRLSAPVQAAAPAPNGPPAQPTEAQLRAALGRIHHG